MYIFKGYTPQSLFLASACSLSARLALRLFLLHRHQPGAGHRQHTDVCRGADMRSLTFASFSNIWILKPAMQQGRDTARGGLVPPNPRGTGTGILGALRAGSDTERAVRTLGA